MVSDCDAGYPEPKLEVVKNAGRVIAADGADNPCMQVAPAEAQDYYVREMSKLAQCGSTTHLFKPRAALAEKEASMSQWPLPGAMDQSPQGLRNS